MNAIEEKELTLYDVIEYAEERARSQRAIARQAYYMNATIYDACMKCAANHEQLATWLKELAEYRAADLVNREELTKALAEQFEARSATGFLRFMKNKTAIDVYNSIVTTVKSFQPFKTIKPVIFYRCDHKVKKCKNSITCGGEDCNLTGDITHAVNFKRQESHDGTVYFVEKANNDQSEA